MIIINFVVAQALTEGLTITQIESSPAVPSLECSEDRVDTVENVESSITAVNKLISAATS